MTTFSLEFPELFDAAGKILHIVHIIDYDPGEMTLSRRISQFRSISKQLGCDGSSKLEGTSY